MQFHQRINPRCNILCAIPPTKYSTTIVRKIVQIFQCNIFHAKLLMKYSAVQYLPCKTTMQMLTMRCHCRDISRCNINNVMLQMNDISCIISWWRYSAVPILPYWYDAIDEILCDTISIILGVSILSILIFFVQRYQRNISSSNILSANPSMKYFVI